MIFQTKKKLFFLIIEGALFSCLPIFRVSNCSRYILCVRTDHSNEICLSVGLLDMNFNGYIGKWYKSRFLELYHIVFVNYMRNSVPDFTRLNLSFRFVRPSSRKPL